MKRYVKSKSEDVGYALVMNLKELVEDWLSQYRDDRPKGDKGRYDDLVKYLSDKMYDYLQSTSHDEVEKAIEMYLQNNYKEI